MTDREARADLANLLPGEDAVEVPRETVLGAARAMAGTSRLVAPDSKDFDRLFEDFQHTAFRLETLDRYAVPVEEEPLRRFLAGEPLDTGWLEPWLALVRAATAAGKAIQRVHVVSEPPTAFDYLRYEFAYYRHTTAAGEDVRILPRAQAERLGVPAHDFWLFDARQVALMRFDRDGYLHGIELTDDPQVVARCCHWRDVALHYAIPYDSYVAVHGQPGP